MSNPRPIGIGHNGAPADDPPSPPQDAACCRCKHWTPPTERERGEYRMYEIGVSKRPVRKPTGSCDRVLYRPGAITAFAATSDHMACLNYEYGPVIREPVDRRGFVIIHEGGRVVWSGIEGEEPAQFRQGELPL